MNNQMLGLPIVPGTNIWLPNDPYMRSANIPVGGHHGYIVTGEHMGEMALYKKSHVNSAATCGCYTEMICVFAPGHASEIIATQFNRASGCTEIHCQENDINHNFGKLIQVSGLSPLSLKLLANGTIAEQKGDEPGEKPCELVDFCETGSDEQGVYYTKVTDCFCRAECITIDGGNTLVFAKMTAYISCLKHHSYQIGRMQFVN